MNRLACSSGAAALMLCLGGGIPAWGQACDPPGAAAQAGGATTATITGEIAGLSLLLEKMSGQISGHVDTVNVGLGHIADASSAERQRQIRQQSEAQAANNFAPTGLACQAATGSMGMAAANVNTIATQRAMQVMRTQFAGGGAAPPQPAQQRLAQTFSAREQRYASPRDQPAGFSGGAMPDADWMGFTTILSPDTYADQPHTQAAIDAAQLLAQPVPLSDFPVQSAVTPGGKAAYMEDLGHRAAVTLAQAVIDGRVAERTPNPTDQSATWATGILTADGIPTADPIPAQLSLHGLIDIDIMRRYMDPGWHTAMQTIEPADAQRELLRMQALELQITWMSYQLQEQQAVSAATLLARLDKATTGPTVASAVIPVAAPTGGQKN